MPLNVNLPTNVTDGAAGHSAGHNATNTALNAIGAAVDTLTAGGGAAGSLVLGRTAGSTALSGHRLVVPTSATVVAYADNTTSSHLGAPLWLTLGAASAGAPVDILASGPVTEPSWAWTRGPVYLGTNGQLTQTVPTAAAGAMFLAVAGFALSATTVLLDPRPPIALS